MTHPTGPAGVIYVDGADNALRTVALAIEALREVERILVEMDASDTHTDYNRSRLSSALNIARRGLGASR